MGQNPKLSQVQNYSFFILLLLFVFKPNMAYSQQTNFALKNANQQTAFSYEWKQGERTYNLQFALANSELYAMPASPSKFNQQLLIEYVYRKVMQEAQQIDPRTANIRVKKSTNGLSFKIKSRQNTDAIMERLTLANEQAKDEYLANNMLVSHQVSQRNVNLRHDYSRYTQQSSQYLQTIVKAIQAIQQQVNNPREFVEIALSWIQNIPYNTLESRVDSNGAGFVSPRDLMMQNQGDCDSKATLMAAILKAYNSNIDVQMVYLPEHALLGVAMRPQAGDTSVTKNETDYVLIESTGPAQYAIGEVSDTSSMKIRNRQFSMITL